MLMLEEAKTDNEMGFEYTHIKVCKSNKTCYVSPKRFYFISFAASFTDCIVFLDIHLFLYSYVKIQCSAFVLGYSAQRNASPHKVDGRRSWDHGGWIQASLGGSRI